MSPAPRFSAPWDRTTQIISALCCAIMFAVAVLVHQILLVPLFLLIAAVAYAYSPRAYAVSPHAITVKRLIGDAVIPLEHLLEARRATREDFAGCIRLWGSGGLFGYYGLFRTRALGRSTWYATDRKRMVVVVTAEKTALFSPGDVEGFLAAIPSPAPGRPVNVPPPDPAWHSSNVGLWVGGAVGITVAVVIALAMTYSPGPPSYTLSPGSLRIDDRFYPVTVQANAVDVPQIRVVALEPGSEWCPTTRTNGFSNSHYHSGWYRLANGRKARMYWARSRRLVLLPPRNGGDPVLLEAGDPDQLVRALKQQWSK